MGVGAISHSENSIDCRLCSIHSGAVTAMGGREYQHQGDQLALSLTWRSPSVSLQVQSLIPGGTFSILHTCEGGNRSSFMASRLQSSHLKAMVAAAAAYH